MFGLSVIIPALNEELNIGATLVDAAKAGADEIIVVDGGSADSTVDISKSMGCRVITSARGRADQMNAGARAARGDVFLFLHADTRLPPVAREVIQKALGDPGVVGGRFDLRMDRGGWRSDLLAGLINWRSRLSRISTGDQAIFVRREVFSRIGGFPGIPLMEDVELSRRLKRAGRVACLRQRVVTSARRWERHGWLRTILLMWLLRFLYFAGMDPARLRRLYYGG